MSSVDCSREEYCSCEQRKDEIKVARESVMTIRDDRGHPFTHHYHLVIVLIRRRKPYKYVTAN